MVHAGAEVELTAKPRKLFSSPLQKEKTHEAGSDIRTTVSIVASTTILPPCHAATRDALGSLEENGSPDARMPVSDLEF
jgi:hypothetical protein